MYSIEAALKLVEMKYEIEKSLKLMEPKTVLCEHCREHVEYSCRMFEAVDGYGGVMVTYLAEDAHCNKCHNPIYVGVVHDRNLIRYNEAFQIEYNKQNK